MRQRLTRLRVAMCSAAIGGALSAVMLPAMLVAQSRPRVSASLETGAAAVEQPLVRSGAAYYITPSAQLTAHDLTVGGNAVFATGTPVWQSFLGNGFVRSPAVKNIRLTGSGQLLKTSGLVHTLHADVGAEWRTTVDNAGVVLRGSAGQMRYSGLWYRDLDIGATVLQSHGAMLFALDASYAAANRPTTLQNQLGVITGTGTTFDARTLDVTPRMIWERGRLRTDVSVALRAVQQGVRGTRFGPQLAFTVEAKRGVSLFVGGVQRLPDARTGIPAGRTALFGVRVEGRNLLSGATRALRQGTALRTVNGILVLDVGAGTPVRVDLRGDFTDWQPRPCQSTGGRRFECGRAPPAGTWRVAVRLNDGAWQQPSNLAAAADDFGSVDGVLMTGGKP